MKTKAHAQIYEILKKWSQWEISSDVSTWKGEIVQINSPMVEFEKSKEQEKTKLKISTWKEQRLESEA